MGTQILKFFTVLFCSWSYPPSSILITRRGRSCLPRTSRIKFELQCNRLLQVEVLVLWLKFFSKDQRCFYTPMWDRCITSTSNEHYLWRPRSTVVLVNSSEINLCVCYFEGDCCHCNNIPPQVQRSYEIDTSLGKQLRFDNAVLSYSFPSWQVNGEHSTNSWSS